MSLKYFHLSVCFHEEAESDGYSVTISGKVIEEIEVEIEGCTRMGEAESILGKSFCSLEIIGHTLLSSINVKSLGLLSLMK